MYDSLRERVAAFEHEQWSQWARHLLDNLTPENIAKWRRQIAMPYDQLTEEEKDKDREWGDRVLALIRCSQNSV